MDLMKLGVATPDVLVDVRDVISDRVEELPDGGLRIGGAISNSDLAAHRATRLRYPVLSEALLSSASGQLRNLATVAGNLLQRTRCVYFSILQRKVLTPADAASLDDLAAHILAFQAYYEVSARPFEWKFTRADLAKLLQRLASKEAGRLPEAA